jgi:hypothetical protein
MPELDQLRDDISALPATAQQLVTDFVAFLKQRYSLPEPAAHIPLNLERFLLALIKSLRCDHRCHTLP